jgi:hypothetical protein
MAGFSDNRDEVHGSLTTDGDLALPLETGGDPLAALTGRVRLAIRDGSTSGRSLLETSLDALIAVAQPLDLLAGAGWEPQALRGGSMVRELRDRGRLTHQDLRIIGHGTSIWRDAALADLARHARRAHLRQRAATRPGGVRRTSPHVSGTLGDPRVEVSRHARSRRRLSQPPRRKLERSRARPRASWGRAGAARQGVASAASPERLLLVAHGRQAALFRSRGDSLQVGPFGWTIDRSRGGDERVHSLRRQRSESAVLAGCAAKAIA